MLDTSIPIDFHPDTIQGDALGPHLEIARAALSTLYERWAVLNHADRSVKDKSTLAVEATNAITSVVRSVDTKVAQLRKAQELNDVALESVLKPQTDDPAAAEIRAHFAKQDYPATEASKLVLQGDSRTV